MQGAKPVLREGEERVRGGADAPVPPTRNRTYTRDQYRPRHQRIAASPWLVRHPFPNRKARRAARKQLKDRMNKLRRYALKGSKQALEKLILITQTIQHQQDVIDALDNWNELMEPITDEEREMFGDVLAGVSEEDDVQRVETAAPEESVDDSGYRFFGPGATASGSAGRSEGED